MKQSALITLLVLAISSVGLAAAACSGDTDDDVAESEEQSIGSVEIMGRVEDVEGSVLTLTTFDDTVNILVSGASSIQKMCEGSLADITIGEDISVLGRTGESGAIDATSITIIPGSMTSLLAPQRDDRLGLGLPGSSDRRNGGQEVGRPQAPGGIDALDGFPGGEGISGTVQEIEGNVVILSTSEGTTDVLVSDETSIQNVCEGSLSDITIDKMVTVSGSQKEDGSIEAANIFIIPGFVRR